MNIATTGIFSDISEHTILPGTGRWRTEGVTEGDRREPRRRRERGGLAGGGRRGSFGTGSQLGR